MFEVIINFFLSSALVVFSLGGADLFSPIVYEQAYEQTREETIRRDFSTGSLGVELTAMSAGAWAEDKWLYEKDIDKVRPIASITKLLSALVLVEQGLDWDQEVVMQKQDEIYRPQHAYRGESILARELLYTALVGSDNNAIMALVRYSDLNTDQFVKKMNQKAKDLGMLKARFSDPTGLQPENIASAREVVLLARAAWQNPEIARASSLSDYRFSPQNSPAIRRVFSTNDLLATYVDVRQGKTGFIDEAGYCLVAKIVGQDGQIIFTVVLGSSEDSSRFQDTKALSWWVFENYIWP